MKNFGCIGNVMVMFLVDMVVGVWWVGLNDVLYWDFWFFFLEIFFFYGSNVLCEKLRWERGINF